jgi:hypothetical protein
MRHLDSLVFIERLGPTGIGPEFLVSLFVFLFLV